ncbi:hypothetical protein NL676_027298 [Syzygium grande]|nr:hypothetical protein NL676_027298 [Syzygium grande]
MGPVPIFGEEDGIAETCDIFPLFVTFRLWIAVQAMKCLGFMIHHPTILASIPGDSSSISFFFLDAIWDETRVYVLEWRKMAFLGAAVGVAGEALE